MIVAGLELTRTSVVALLTTEPCRPGRPSSRLGRLADDDRPRSEHEDLLQVVPTRHVSMNPGRNRPNRPRLSVRARVGLRVVLHAGVVDVEQPEALDGPVVQVHVRQLGGAEVGLEATNAELAGHREAVVLRGDRDAAGGEVLDRVIGAAVAERELERLHPGGACRSSWWPRQIPNTGLRHQQRPEMDVDQVAERRRVPGAWAPGRSGRRVCRLRFRAHASLHLRERNPRCRRFG